MSSHGLYLPHSRALLYKLLALSPSPAYCDYSFEGVVNLLLCFLSSFTQALFPLSFITDKHNCFILFCSDEWGLASPIRCAFQTSGSLELVEVHQYQPERVPSIGVPEKI